MTVDDIVIRWHKLNPLSFNNLKSNSICPKSGAKAKKGLLPELPVKEEAPDEDSFPNCRLQKEIPKFYTTQTLSTYKICSDRFCRRHRYGAGACAVASARPSGKFISAVERQSV